MDNKKNIILDNYYSEIEKITEITTHISLPNIETMPEEILFYLRIEILATQTVLIEKPILELFEQRKDEAIKYIDKRLLATSNIILKAKYNEFIYILTKNNSYCHEAISYYQEALKTVFEDPQREYYEVCVDRVFKKVLDLSLKIKYKVSELKQQIISYLTDSSIAERLRTRLSMSVKERNVFNAEDSVGFPQLFISLAESSDDTNWVENNLNLALFYASKDVNNQQQIQLIYELLGDNKCKQILPEDENNINIPHMNEHIYEQIISYYQKAKCYVKEGKIWESHRNNKKNKKYITISEESEITQEHIDTLKKSLELISSSPTRFIVANLVFCKGFPFIPNHTLEDNKNNREKLLYEQFYTPVQEDTNYNHKESDPDYNYKFFVYDIMMGDNIDFIFSSILQCIEKRKLSYKKLHSTLLKYYSFGQPHQKYFNGNAISYSWLSIIDLGIESFFTQCYKFRKSKETDWQICIDILSIKFEGIFRQILEYNGANMTKLKNGNTSEITLEDMVRLKNKDMSEAFYKTFDNDDLNLFQYAFSSMAQCLNIRNNVAHCYYIPQEYSYKKAVVVLLAVLRLAKYIPKND